ncbi:hypothetical protein DWV00_27070 [Trinickia dinghuensis]|uniref:Uncharacterized protein n=1 Tax=Trinickia dinghuensis TaxID=2291023 RepID=A0A3D8JTN9_9BURK|nr:hypothetical protein [Trinickia dinghuensis]RDU95934.1 hypothetical protein DWV00_27070 [Trinickia dinghuensis]
MNSNVVSLRSLIDKWLAPTPASPICVTRLSYARSRPTRCVRVESVGSSGALAIFFFRHANGSWSVSPPELERPAMAY